MFGPLVVKEVNFYCSYIWETKWLTLCLGMPPVIWKEQKVRALFPADLPCCVMLAVSPFRMCCHTHAQTFTFVQSHLEDFCHRWSALLFLFTFTLPWWFLMIWPLRITVWLKSWRRVVLTGATEALGWLESLGFGMCHFLAYAKALCSSSTHWRHSLEPHCKSFDCIVCFTSTLLSTLDSLSALEH